MNRLLSFNPEPFETEEEAEFSSRRSRGRSQYPRSRYARPQRGYARAARPGWARLQQGYTSATGPRLTRLQRGYTGAAGPRLARSLQSITPGSIQASGRRPTPPDRRRPPPYGWFPTYPLVEPAWPVAVAPDGPPEEPAAPAPPATGPATQPEPSGSASEHARWVQSCLNQVMGLRLRVNGVMSPETRSAVRGFQERQGLRIDGLVGPETERALAEACKGASAPEPAPATAGNGGASAPEPVPAPASNGGASAPEPAPAPAGNGGASAPEPAPAVAGNGGASEIEARELLRAADAGLLTRGRRRLPSRAAAPPTAAPAPFDSEVFRQRIVQIANQELERWGNGRIKETDPRIRQVLRDYWKTGAGADYSDAQLGDPSFQADHPWSAAFISWVMKTAGAGPAFKYSSAHSTYTRWAKDNRVASADNPFKAYRTTEIVPQVGDIVCRSRAGSGATYDNIRPGMKTHCDIVTEVRPGSLLVIGGNVCNSVYRKPPLKTDASGRLVDPNYFAVIRIGTIQPSVPIAPTPRPVAPGAGIVPRLIRQEAVPAGTTLYVEIDLQIVDKLRITAPTVTGIFIPDRYAPSQTADLILYLHGHKAEALRRQGIDQYWNSQRFPYAALREGLNDSGRNVILVAPSLGSCSETGRLTGPGGLDAYIERVLAALKAYGPHRPLASAPALGSLVLACHSGGGFPMRQLAGGRDRALARLRECWGFDCTYNHFPTSDDVFWSGWARAHRNARVYIYYIPGSLTAALAEALRDKRVPNAVVLPSREKRHNYVPIAHWRVRVEGAGFLIVRPGGAIQPPGGAPQPAAPVDVRQMTKQQFIDFVGDNARRAMMATGVPASVTVAQAILETGWGKHTVGEAKNLFGIKGRGPAGSVRAPTREYLNGKWVTVDADFAKYDSFEQSITEHARFFLRNRRYARALQVKDDPDAFAREIHKAGYATVPDYASALIALMRQHNLYRFDRVDQLPISPRIAATQTRAGSPRAGAAAA